jgi:nucleotide-binding universal stress UspA family protein
MLVGLDGSDGARRAADWAAALALQLGSTVTAVHALGFLHQRADDSFHAADADREAIFREVSDDWCAPLRDADVTHVAVLAEGPPAPAILATADEVGADLIVLGSRGLGGFPQLLLGSTSAQVVTHSSRPVVVVPNVGTAWRGLSR